MGKQLSLTGPKKHLVPQSFFITVRSRMLGAAFAHPLLVNFFPGIGLVYNIDSDFI